MVVILVVLTGRVFRFSLHISQLMAKAIPVRGAKFKKACFRAGFLLFGFHAALRGLRRHCRAANRATCSARKSISCGVL
ncbi:hypothetical protein DMR30_23315 [Klebsiella variicola]|nr:hypothetical protein DMR30_23315 [Klebsiella variicola]